MLKQLMRFSLDNAGLVIILAGLLIAYAGYEIPRMPVDVFPELNAPTVVIMSEAGGLAADEVEQYVTFPVESTVNGLPGVRRVRSSSAISLSIVWVEFAWGFDIYRARQLVSERLAIARESLPEQVHTELAPISSITGEIMLLSVSSPDGSASDLALRAFAEFDLRNRLLAVPGVSQVVTTGGELPEYQINVRQERLLLYDLSLQDVVDAAGEAHTIAGAGYLLDFEGQEIPMQQTGRVRSVDDIKSTIVTYHRGTPVTIGQVADVRLKGGLKRGTGAEGGTSAVVISVQKAPGVNTLQLTKDVDRALDSLEAGLKEGIRVNRHVFRQSDFIQLSVDNVLTVLRDAAIFVAIILVLFLLNVRTTIITLLAIPLSLAMAVLALWLLGMTVNVMTLGGLAVAIGELVDDAIIYVENIFRRLRGNALLPVEKRRPHAEVVFSAGNEIRKSVVFATVIIVIVFVPLLFLQGIEGRFFFPLGVAYIVSILASLVVAITVTVSLCKLLLRSRLGRPEREGFLVRWLKGIYEPAVRGSIRYRKVLLGSAIVATVLALWLASTFGTSFLPKFNEGTFTVFLWAPPGTSLAESDRLARGVESRLLEVEGVRSVVRRTGRAERDEHAEPVSNSEIEVTTEPGVPRSAVEQEIHEVLNDVPGINTNIGQPIEHRLSHILSGTPAAIAINVYGEELAVLRKIASEIETELKSVPGARDVTASREVRITSLPIRYRSGDLGRWGLTPASAAAQVNAAFLGKVVAQVNEGVRRYDIVVRLAEEERQIPEHVRRFVLRGKGGAHARLSEVANIGKEKSPFMILRENARRKAVVSCNVAEGHNLGHLIESVKKRVDPIVHKYGYAVEYGGQFEAQQSASRTIYVMGVGVVFMIFLLLRIALDSMRAAILVMVNLPLAIIGGLLAIFITESENVFANMLGLFGVGTYQAPVVSIASLVGFVTLFGIAVRNGILLVNHYGYLRRVENKPLLEAVVQGSMERLVPILMTAITAILGLLPLAMAAGEPGSELLAPLAVVVLGGLVTSTLLNLIVVPAGYVLIFRDSNPDIARSRRDIDEPESPHAQPNP